MARKQKTEVVVELTRDEKIAAAFKRKIADYSIRGDVTDVLSIIPTPPEHAVLRVVEQEQSNFDILYQLQAYHDPFWANGTGDWYPIGVVQDSNTIIAINGFKQEFDMKLILTGILTGMEIMQ